VHILQRVNLKSTRICKAKIGEIEVKVEVEVEVEVEVKVETKVQRVVLCGECFWFFVFGSS
jgi:hypothetical protein